MKYGYNFITNQLPTFSHIPFLGPSDPGLVGVELMIAAFLLDQLIMGSPFHDSTFFDHQNLMSQANRAQPVGDDECRSPLHQGL